MSSGLLRDDCLAEIKILKAKGYWLLQTVTVGRCRELHAASHVAACVGNVLWALTLGVLHPR